MEMKNKSLFLLMFLAIASAFVLANSLLVFANPTGVVISGNVTSMGVDTSPDSRTDPGASITTMVMNVTQQNTYWKAYVGNISGKYTLSDASGSTIFDWSLDTITGEVYSSRSDAVSWGDIACATSGLVETEQTTLGVTNPVYNITRTFNESVHPELTVGISTIAASACDYASSTFVNDARQAQGSASYPMVLLGALTALVYATPINAGATGYDGSTFDFQLIMANNPASTTTYYFYAELG